MDPEGMEILREVRPVVLFQPLLYDHDSKQTGSYDVLPLHVLPWTL